MKQTILKILNDIRTDVSIKDYDTNLFEIGILDSLGIAQFISELEENFSIEVDADDILPENFISIIAVEKLVKKYLGGDYDKN